MTITGEEDAMKMLQDPEIVRVYEYENKASGKTAWACFDEDGVDYDDVASSPFVGEHKLLKDKGDITDIPLLEKIYQCCWTNPEIDSGVTALPDGEHDGYINGINKETVYEGWIEIKDGSLVLESLFNMVSKNIFGDEDGEVTPKMQGGTSSAPPDPDHRFIERVWVNDKGQVEVFLGS